MDQPPPGTWMRTGARGPSGRSGRRHIQEMTPTPGRRYVGGGGGTACGDAWRRRGRRDWAAAHGRRGGGRSRSSSPEGLLQRGLQDVVGALDRETAGGSLQWGRCGRCMARDDMRANSAASQPISQPAAAVIPAAPATRRAGHGDIAQVPRRSQSSWVSAPSSHSPSPCRHRLQDRRHGHVPPR